MQQSDSKVIFKPPDRPVIYSAETNWKGIKLHTLKEFCLIIDTKRQPKLEEYVKKYSIDALINYEFTPEELKKAKHGWDREKQFILDQLRAYKYNFR